MCRWAAYTGKPITLDTVLTLPKNSLVDQSLDAQLLDMPVKTHAAFSPQRRVGTSGEGYGFAWLGRDGQLGRFRDPSPAWDSENVVHLAKHLQSPCFLGHMRASPGRTVNEQNCHPFVHEKIMFQHNGFIGDFPAMRRSLSLLVDPELFPNIQGNTDSEMCFYLALTFGLREDPVEALRKLRATVERERSNVGSELPFVATIAVSDGKRLIVLRTSSRDPQSVEAGFSSPSLYYTSGPLSMEAHGDQLVRLPAGSQLIVSEPLELDYSAEKWLEFPDHSIGVFDPEEEPYFTSAF